MNRLAPLAVAVTLLSVLSFAQTDQGGPDGFGYYWESSQDPADTVRFSWLDASGHSPISSWTPNSDDGWALVNLPYGFPFYGETLTGINVCTNGFLEFPTTFTSYLNLDLPVRSFDHLLAAFWDDLSPAQSGGVYRWDDPAGGFTAITWLNVVRFNTTETLSCQVLLFTDGRIRLNYLRTPLNSNSSTVGIQGDGGASNHYLEYVCDGEPASHVPADSSSVVFFVRRLDHDVGVFRCVSPAGWIPVNGQAPVVGVFKNFGLNIETFTVRALLIHSRFPYDTVYNRTSTITGLAPADTASCYLGDFVVSPSPDSWHVVFKTELATDMYRRNDTLGTPASSFPPAFGTSLCSWAFPELGDGMNLCGITFRADSSRFYVATNDSNRVFSFPAGGPVYGLNQEQFELQNFFGDDIVWGIAWDEHEPGFWLTHVPAYGTGCILARYGPDGTFTGDTWNVGAIEPGAWFAGMDCDAGGSLWATEVGIHNRIYRLNPVVKQVSGFLPGPTASWRACSWLGDNDAYLISGGWNDHAVVRLNRSGEVTQTAVLFDLADLDIYRPASPYPDSLVTAFATRSDLQNTIELVCLGMTWNSIGIGEDRRLSFPAPPLAVFPNPVKGRLVSVRTGSPGVVLQLCDVSGRVVLNSTVTSRRSALDLGGLPAGIYLLRLAGGEPVKLVLPPR